MSQIGSQPDELAVQPAVFQGVEISVARAGCVVTHQNRRGNGIANGFPIWVEEWNSPTQKQQTIGPLPNEVKEPVGISPGIDKSDTVAVIGKFLHPLLDLTVGWVEPYSTYPSLLQSIFLFREVLRCSIPRAIHAGTRIEFEGGKCLKDFRWREPDI